MGSKTSDHHLHGHGGAGGHPSSGLSLAVGGAEADQPDDAEHPRTWLAAYALGALDGDEREMVFLHVQRCDSCRAEVEQFASAAAQLAWAPEPVAVPLRVRAALLHQVDDLARRGEGPLNLGSAVDAHTRYSLGGFRTWPRLPRIAVWSLGPVVAALVIVMVVVMVGIINRQQDALQQAKEQQSETNRILTASGTPAADTTFLASAGAGDARARALMDRDRNLVLIVATNLTQPADGEVYIAWLQISGTEEFARAAVLTIDELGRAQAFATPPDDLSRYSEMSITLEPSANSMYPTGPMLLTATLADPE